MLLKIEEDIHTFAHKVEDSLVNKCNFTTDETCYKANYDRCDSELPYATCPGGDYSNGRCGSGKEGGCGGLFDFTTSVATVAPDKNTFMPTEESDRVKDDVCTTLQLESYMKNVTESSTQYWQTYNVLPPWIYYGTDEGVFRMYPGSPGTCPNGRNNYDPRVRPWYVAASSGPKDVILVLDTSASMDNNGRLGIMKDAAKRVINTLGVSDYFSVIEFGTTANQVGIRSGTQMRANDQNKETMVKNVDALQAKGGTFFRNGFEMAFNIFNESVYTDDTSSCHRAILFLSDGELTDDSESLLKFIKAERAKYSDKNQDAPVIFTYSFGSGADDNVPRDIACQNDGVWSKINDRGDLAKSMGAYYKYFAYGLGDKVNENFVSWVEPYTFATGSGLGTTASAPVYDRTVDPPVLAGVAGMDISLSALQQAFGKFSNSQDSVFDSIVQRSTAYCPKLHLTDCQLESLRRYGSDDSELGNANALCSTCNSTIGSLKAPLCPGRVAKLWNNDFNSGRSFEARTCCSVGAEARIAGTLTDEDIERGKCTSKGLGLGNSNINIGMIVGSLVAGVVVIGLIFVLYKRQQNRYNNNPYITSNTPQEQPQPSSDFDTNSHSVTAHVVEAYPSSPNAHASAPIASFEQDIVVLPVPVAPASKI